MAQQQKRGDSLTALQVMGSIVASAFGVQSNENRQRDFEKGNPKVFFIGGMIFTILFVLSLVVTVQVVVGKV